MKKLLIFLGLALASVSEPSLQAMQPSAPDFSSSDSGNTALCIAGACVVTAVLYKIGSYAYNRYREWSQPVRASIEKTLINQAVDDIYLALTRNKTIAAIKDETIRNEKFCKKAQLVKLRKNVLKKLRVEASSETSGLSNDHKKALENFLTLAEKGFEWIDRLRGDEELDQRSLFGRCVNWAKSTRLGQKLVVPNPCEIGEISPQGNLLGRMIESYKYAKAEDAIVDSILLYCKPVAELTPEDKQKKQEAEQRRETVLTALKAKIRSGAKDKATNAAIGAVMTPIILAMQKLGVTEWQPMTDHEKQGVKLLVQLALVTLSLVAMGSAAA